MASPLDGRIRWGQGSCDANITICSWHQDSLQTFFGTQLPAVVGGSYAYVMPILYIINDSSLQRIQDRCDRFTETMRAIQGALIVASSIQIIAGYSQLWGLFSRYIDI